MTDMFGKWRKTLMAIGAGVVLVSAPLSAQGVETIDPSAGFGSGIDADLGEQPGDAPVYADEQVMTDPADAGAQAGVSVAQAAAPDDGAEVAYQWSDPAMSSGGAIAGEPGAAGQVAEASATTYKQDDLIGAAQGVFGEGAEGVAKMIQDLLAEQGEPNGYIVGREAGGAFIVGARYGSGTLYHKVEGERPVYWTGPSIGFDAGANAGNTFVLVYNLYDTEQLYERFPAGEGQAYVLGGMTASYLRKGNTVLIPIRVGAGLRLGVNAGYMKFSKKQRWLPF